MMQNLLTKTKKNALAQERAQKQEQKQLPIFVYGTLRRNMGNYNRLLSGRTVEEYPAVLPNHKMYSVGIAYVCDTGAGEAGQVVGEVMYIEPNRYEEVLARLDSLEGYRPGGDKRFNHYERVCRTALVTTDSGEHKSVEVWVYHGGTDQLKRFGEQQRVTSGDWFDTF
jgi:gamma-glutamylcyclotransferase (GGCT)/AIG2-like uncharacterized protein YtfP